MTELEPPPEPTPPRGGIQVLRRAAMILRTVAGHPGGLRLGPLAGATGLPKPTVHRIVRALADEHLLRIDPAGHIRIGPAMVELAGNPAVALTARMHPLLVDLRHEIDETVDLSVLDGARIRFIDQIQCSHELQALSAVGSSFPLHCTANGKALLAALPPDRAEALLPWSLEPMTEHTTVDPDRLRLELQSIRDTGLAYDRQEHSIGIMAVGAVVHDRTGPVAAVSVPVPLERYARVEPLITRALPVLCRRASALLSA